MNTPTTTVSLWRRLAAILYDALLVLAVVFFASFIALAFNRGEAITHSPWYTLYLLGVVYLYFAWFWTRSGQTLGMKTWRIRVVDAMGDAIDWHEAMVRYLMAMVSWGCLGLGFWWSLWDGEGRTWHDRVSRTHLIPVPKQTR